ncbi:MAG: hypothetical protein LBQ38_03855 [Spirochaetaceae bacterium]|jgi:uncharacterized integral membrane protein|nr:hypothetical protein [Spirochaetaceae bacterium]
MPWRLIGFVILFAIFLIFIGFNLGNSCDINFVFITVPQVPVYLTAFTSFVLGILWAIPFFASIRRKKAKKDAQRGLPDVPVLDMPPKSGKFKPGKNKNTPPEFPGSPEGGSYGDGGSYGID